jgi:hypothetical protein
MELQEKILVFCSREICYLSGNFFAVFEYYFDRSVKTFYNRTSMQTEMPGSHWIHIHVTETFWDGGKDGKRKNQQFI